VRRASAAALAEPAAERASDGQETYDVVLLAGSPLRYTLRLNADLAEGAIIDVDGEQWTVADVRLVEGSPSRLICIYAV